MSDTTTHDEVEPKGTAGPEVGWRLDIPGAEKNDMRPINAQLLLSIVGLGLGIIMGLLQALERADIDLYQEIPIIESYYQGLTLHGVALALIFTFTFANAFTSLAAMKAFGQPLFSRPASWLSAGAAWLGVVLAAWAILANEATVLFTFYSPMQAHVLFYLGAALLVVSTWLVLLNILWTLKWWRLHDDHDEDRIPLLGYLAIMTNLMWSVASVGIAIEVLGFLIPWSLGWIDTVDPQFTRTLFWFTGHPIVYYWLLPVYISWYMFLPAHVGGKVYSDGLVRVVFLSFLLLIPVGVHHQFTDPGIAFSSKTIQWMLTFLIFFPSVVTAFSVIAALEEGGRKAGGRGLIGWIFKLPWGRPEVSGQLLGGLAFMLGGASGLINASYTVNLTVHNSSFVVGHFHLTVGTAVALSIMAICYWLVPYMTGRKLWGRMAAVIQTFTWFIGVLIFSRGQMAAGVEGQPRRTQIADATYLADHPEWDFGNLMTAVGGSLMFIAGAMFLVIILGTALGWAGRVTEAKPMEITQLTHGPHPTRFAFLDRIGVWAAIAAGLAVLVYGEVMSHYLPIHQVAPGISDIW